MPELLRTVLDAIFAALQPAIKYIHKHKSRFPTISLRPYWHGRFDFRDYLLDSPSSPSQPQFFVPGSPPDGVPSPRPASATGLEALFGGPLLGYPPTHPPPTAHGSVHRKGHAGPTPRPHVLRKFVPGIFVPDGPERAFNSTFPHAAKNNTFGHEARSLPWDSDSPGMRSWAGMAVMVILVAILSWVFVRVFKPYFRQPAPPRVIYRRAGTSHTPPAATTPALLVDIETNNTTAIESSTSLTHPAAIDAVLRAISDGGHVPVAGLEYSQLSIDTNATVDLEGEEESDDEVFVLALLPSIPAVPVVVDIEPEVEVKPAIEPKVAEAVDSEDSDDEVFVLALPPSIPPVAVVVVDVEPEVEIKPAIEPKVTEAVDSEKSQLADDESEPIKSTAFNIKIQKEAVVSKVPEPKVDTAQLAEKPAPKSVLTPVVAPTPVFKAEAKVTEPTTASTSVVDTFANSKPSSTQALAPKHALKMSTSTSKPEIPPKGKISEPKVVKPQVIDSQVVTSQIVESDAFKSNAVVPTAGESKAIESKVVKPTLVVANVVVSEPTGSKIYDSEPKLVEPTEAALESEGAATVAMAHKVNVVEPKNFEPKTVESKAVRPQITEPKTVESKSVDPKAVGSKIVKPPIVQSEAGRTRITVKSQIVESSSVESKAGETKAIESEAIESEVVEANAVVSDTVVEPKNFEPQMVESKAVRPHVTESKTVESQGFHPKAVESKIVKPHIVESEAGRTHISESKTVEAKGAESKSVKPVVSELLDKPAFKLEGAVATGLVHHVNIVEPTIAKPKIVDSKAVRPQITESKNKDVHPPAIEPKVEDVHPKAIESKFGEAEAAESKDVKSKSTDAVEKPAPTSEGAGTTCIVRKTSVVEPQAVKSLTLESETVKPRITESRPAESKIVVPKTIESKVVESKVVKPQIPESNALKLTITESVTEPVVKEGPAPDTQVLDVGVSVPHPVVRGTAAGNRDKSIVTVSQVDANKEEVPPASTSTPVSPPSDALKVVKAKTTKAEGRSTSPGSTVVVIDKIPSPSTGAGSTMVSKTLSQPLKSQLQPNAKAGVHSTPTVLSPSPLRSALSSNMKEAPSSSLAQLVPAATLPANKSSVAHVSKAPSTASTEKAAAQVLLKAKRAVPPHSDPSPYVPLSSTPLPTLTRISADKKTPESTSLPTQRDATACANATKVGVKGKGRAAIPTSATSGATSTPNSSLGTGTGAASKPVAVVVPSLSGPIYLARPATPSAPSVRFAPRPQPTSIPVPVSVSKSVPTATPRVQSSVVLALPPTLNQKTQSTSASTPHSQTNPVHPTASQGRPQSKVGSTSNTNASVDVTAVVVPAKTHEGRVAQAQTNDKKAKNDVEKEDGQGQLTAIALVKEDIPIEKITEQKDRMLENGKVVEAVVVESQFQPEPEVCESKPVPALPTVKKEENIAALAMAKSIAPSVIAKACAPAKFPFPRPTIPLLPPGSAPPTAASTSSQPPKASNLPQRESVHASNRSTRPNWKLVCEEEKEKERASHNQAVMLSKQSSPSTVVTAPASAGNSGVRPSALPAPSPQTMPNQTLCISTSTPKKSTGEGSARPNWAVIWAQAQTAQAHVQLRKLEEIAREVDDVIRRVEERAPSPVVPPSVRVAAANLTANATSASTSDFQPRVESQSQLQQTATAEPPANAQAPATSAPALVAPGPAQTDATPDSLKHLSTSAPPMLLRPATPAQVLLTPAKPAQALLTPMVPADESDESWHTFSEDFGRRFGVVEAEEEEAAAQARLKTSHADDPVQEVKPAHEVVEEPSFQSCRIPESSKVAVAPGTASGVPITPFQQPVHEVVNEASCQSFRVSESESSPSTHPSSNAVVAPVAAVRVSTMTPQAVPLPLALPQPSAPKEIVDVPVAATESSTAAPQSDSSPVPLLEPSAPKETVVTTATAAEGSTTAPQTDPSPSSLPRPSTPKETTDAPVTATEGSTTAPQWHSAPTARSQPSALKENVVVAATATESTADPQPDPAPVPPPPPSAPKETVTERSISTPPSEPSPQPELTMPKSPSGPDLLTYYEQEGETGEQEPKTRNGLSSYYDLDFPRGDFSPELDDAASSSDSHPALPSGATARHRRARSMSPPIPTRDPLAETRFGPPRAQHRRDAFHGPLSPMHDWEREGEFQMNGARLSRRVPKATVKSGAIAVEVSTARMTVIGRPWALQIAPQGNRRHWHTGMERRQDQDSIVFTPPTAVAASTCPNANANANSNAPKSRSDQKRYTPYRLANRPRSPPRPSAHSDAQPTSPSLSQGPGPHRSRSSSPPRKTPGELKLEKEREEERVRELARSIPSLERGGSKAGQKKTGGREMVEKVSRTTRAHPAASEGAGGSATNEAAPWSGPASLSTPTKTPASAPARTPAPASPFAADGTKKRPLTAVLTTQDAEKTAPSPKRPRARLYIGTIELTP